MLSAFIEAETARLGAAGGAEAEPSDPGRLDQVLHEMLVAVNGPEPFGRPGGRVPA